MFDMGALAAALTHGPVVRVAIAGFEGSSPREVGAAMLIWADGATGTIGGGALEWEAMAQARAMLAAAPLPASPSPAPSPRGGGEVPLLTAYVQADSTNPPTAPRGQGIGGRLCKVDRVALGPTLGQCCGGAVTLWYERFDSLPAVQDGMFARGPGVMPLAVKRLFARARGQGVVPVPGVVQGWLVEPVARPERQVWVWGAGHVGRAVVGVLAPLPGVAITWLDVDRARFPGAVPDGVRVMARADVAGAVADATMDAEHLVMTFSHALDLELCHLLLTHGFARLGLIGSATKWARFRSRLAALGHLPGAIARIDCPIGDPGLGKHPQAIAIGVAAAFLGAAAVKGNAVYG